MRYLGVDPGGKRVGLAVGDSDTGVASPICVVNVSGVKQAARAVAEAATRLGAECVVVGLPVLADGSHTPACRRSEALSRELSSLGLAVELQPEYLTSDEARRRAREVGIRGQEPVDHIAAQVLLEEYLDRR